VSSDFSIGALAIAAYGSSFVGAVRLTCADDVLTIELVRAAGFSSGFVPGATAEAVSFSLPYVAVRGLARRGRCLAIAFDRRAGAPLDRLCLVRFGDDPLAMLLGAHGRRALARFASFALPLPTAILAALRAPAALVSGLGGRAALGVLVGLLVFAVLRELCDWITWGGLRSVRARDTFEAELALRLGVSPARAEARAWTGEDLGPSIESSWRPLAAVVSVVLVFAGAIAAVQYERTRPPPPPPPLAQIWFGPHFQRIRRLIPPPPVVDRCTCQRANSPLWIEGIPIVSVVVAARDGSMEVAPRPGGKRYDFFVFAVNNTNRPLHDVDVTLMFARRDKSGNRVNTAERGLHADRISAGTSARWRVRAPGTEYWIEPSRLGKLGTEANAAEADLFAALGAVKYPALRAHAAMMLAYLRDPRAKDAANSLVGGGDAVERLRAQILRAASPEFACAVTPSGTQFEVCVVNERNVVGAGLQLVDASDAGLASPRRWPIPVDVPVHDGVRVKLALMAGPVPTDLALERAEPAAPVAAPSGIDLVVDDGLAP